MKPQLLKVSTTPVHSFSARQDNLPYINNRWHYHPEVELIHFKKGSGTQFIGDSIKRFQSGDVVLVGSNLPHYWRFDDSYFEKHNNPEKQCLIENQDYSEKLNIAEKQNLPERQNHIETSSPNTADVRVIHFNEIFWGSIFLNLPENTLLKNTLERAKRGLQINGPTKTEIGNILEKLLTSEGTSKLILLLQALQNIGTCDQTQSLSSIGFKHNFEETENDRIHAIYEFSLANFKRKIKTSEVAEIAHVSTNYFCRYFKSRTRKTYSQFINEIRIGHACKLLIENKINIKQICYESGFYNFASFHQYFKSITKKSPLIYQREFLKERLTIKN